MEILLLLLLGLSILGMIYLSLNIRVTSSYIGILPEMFVRQIANIKKEEYVGIPLETQRKIFGEKKEEPEPKQYQHLVVFPIKHQYTSRLPDRMYENESGLIVLHPFLREWNEDDSLLVVDLGSAPEDAGTGEEGDEDDSYYVVDLGIAPERSNTELETYAVLQLTRQRLAGKPLSTGTMSLAIELIAPGFEIAGEKKQKRDLREPIPTYTWGITPTVSGNHQIALSITAENDQANKVAEIGTITHSIRVVSIDGLTYRQAKLLTGAVGAVTVILAILEALKRLQILH